MASEPTKLLRRATILLLAVILGVTAGCASRKPVSPKLSTIGDADLLALSDALEALIDDGHDTPADREYAYEIARSHDEDAAAVLFARAVITGRFVQSKGLLAAKLVTDIERCARRSRELDPTFRAGAATRLLGTLYVMAPAPLLAHGNSETGIDLLEGLVEQRPDVVENHLRLAEAYIALNDPDPARPHLCLCLAHQSQLRGDDQRLLAHLIADAGQPTCGQAAGDPQ